jgi:hypothetical protein
MLGLQMASKPTWLKFVELYERGIITAIEFMHCFLECTTADNVDEIIRDCPSTSLQLIRDSVFRYPADDDEAGWCRHIRGSATYWDPKLSDDEISAAGRDADARFRNGVRVLRGRLTSQKA